jgi:hypothetical protein
MKIVALDDQKVCLPTLQDANQLMQALIRYNCESQLQKYDSFGEEAKPGDFTILFDDFEINVINQTNTETVLHWFMSLGVTDIFVKRIERAES